jgi:hypothetical protein
LQHPVIPRVWSHGSCPTTCTGAATVAAGLLADAQATPASAAGTAAQAQPGEPMVAHVKDVRTGEIDLFVGTRHLNFHSPEIAALLAREL